MTAPDGAHARHREQQIRRILTEHVDQIVPAEGLAEIRARIAAPRPWWRRWWDAARAFDRHLTTGFASIALTPHSKNGAPGWTPGTPPTAAPLGGDTAMDSIPRQAQQLRPDDIITRHPDHPNREVWYRVDGWPRRVSHAQMLVNYTCRPARISGDSAGVLILDIDQECQVVPAHTQGGAA